ncbi:hypothetical protein [Hwanghaeella sp. LZ110]|uniref:hypothetical protein n=1 Tax=Hwanghaeella sp. LZ110 TaxID=3402810 RepID=UPI003B679673
MDSYDYWRLCDRLSILQAALLMIGEDPSGEMKFVEQKATNLRPIGYEASKEALIDWLVNDQVKGTILYETYEGDGFENFRAVDISLSRVDVESLRGLLSHRGFRDGFFVHNDSKSREYLDPENEFYSPKLAAAITAWEKVTSDPTLTNGKTPKQALEKWLREHANDFGLTGSDGNPVAAAIDQIAKVTNWKPEGGASKTPTHIQVQDNLSPDSKDDINQNVTEDYKDSDPF